MDKNFFQNGLHGKGAHVDTATVFDGLAWQLAGEKREHCPHSVWELLNHMLYWQDFMLAYLKGEVPESPEHAMESWPDSSAPASQEEWEGAVSRFLKSLQEAEQEGAKDLMEKCPAGKGRTRAEWLMGIALHNTYHAGQVAMVRRMSGAWPPPSGGDTW
ncbi:DinB family protein [Planomicrobium sp. CPCC 101110]|uniref:DinB family protein n=1 Tax=Planomicrobium sp. CPCC 101110 TaxID=2599619 RepID=UPI0011B5DF08|nr:DinB family protein [Planomicrobium sp. CPCC 101110]TWT25120.1 DinB family protein [Planomicrobium sp. CPCC 101110]